ncbi:MAG TPA: hypothetical protein VNG94_06725, partial [Pyrinomonadaceae bacterium]|nr:hypothetical protein [Pyrinomonadaceae bacterium]
MPVETLLSHDLFESIFARAALVSDLEFFDDYPANYDTYAMRQHRWTRGDWQITGWLGRRVPDAQGHKRPNRIAAISRWKMLDNLRRSLLAPTLTLFLIAGWTILPNSIWWTLFALLVLAFPVYAHVTTGLLIHPRGVPWTSHFWSVWGDLRTNTGQLILEIVFLAHQAYLMTDAITRTFYRKSFSRKHLLEWTTAAGAEKASKHDLPSFVRFMWPAAAIAFIATVFIVVLRLHALPVAAPFLMAWIVSPLVAFLVSRRHVEQVRELPAGERRHVRSIARRTWRFFQTFVGDEDHWLPPDNVQEEPQVIAHRTSPTNIGLLMLLTLSAYDFGYIGLVELIERLEFTFASLEKLQKFRGHFFNWHDTRTLQPMWPHYVSVVDSGNLCGHLIALKQGCIELPDDELFNARVIAGLQDTLDAVAAESSQLATAMQRTDAITIRQLRGEVQACAGLLAGTLPTSLTRWSELIDSLNEHAAVIDDIVAALSQEHGKEEFADLRWWAGSLLHQVRAYRRDLHLLAPWGPVSSVLTGAEIASDRWQVIARKLEQVPSLAHVSETCDTILIELAAWRAELEQINSIQDDKQKVLAAIGQLTSAVEQALEAASTLTSRLAKIAQTSTRIVDETDFKFLLDQERKVFTIGYNVSEGRHDNSFYDLLASEARLASFIAIAKGDVPQEHWFRMGRQLTAVDGG